MQKEPSKYDFIRSIVWTLIYVVIIFLLFGFHHDIIALLMIGLFFWKPVRYVIFNFDLLLRSGVINAFNYWRYKEYNYPQDIGTIDMYVAHTNKVFGCCKTLSAVVRAKRLYDKYNGAATYDYKCQNPHWVTWRVQVLSNVDIVGVPTIPFENFNQLVELSDIDTDGLYTVVVLDECNAVMNSRNFKNNFQNEEQIKSIVCARHNNITMLLCGQKYKYCDSLLRNMTDRVYECVHIPLFNTVVHHVYSAYDLETCDNPRMIKRLALNIMYVFQNDYKLYDTKAEVAMIAKTPNKSSAELVAQKGNQQTDIEATRNLSPRGKKLQRKALL